MSAREESDVLHARVQRFIAESLAGAATEPFDRLACDIARFQARWIEPVRRLYEALGVTAETLESSERIPAVPTDVFRLRRVAAHPEADDRRVFRTSGTTGASSCGSHAFRSLETYWHACNAWA